MVKRNRSYLYIDGTFLNIDDLHCLYITPDRTAIVAVFMDGQQSEIKYASKKSCSDAWGAVYKEFKVDIEVGGIYIFPHKTIIMRIVNLRFVEFDTIDHRFAMQYRTGETFVYKYASAKVTHEIFKRMMDALAGEKVTDALLPIEQDRRRADFWANPITTIDGLTVGGDIPNSEYWVRVDKAYLDARRG